MCDQLGARRKHQKVGSFCKIGYIYALFIKWSSFLLMKSSIGRCVKQPLYEVPLYCRSMNCKTCGLVYRLCRRLQPKRLWFESRHHHVQDGCSRAASKVAQTEAHYMSGWIQTLLLWREVWWLDVLKLPTIFLSLYFLSCPLVHFQISCWILSLNFR